MAYTFTPATDKQVKYVKYLISATAMSDTKRTEWESVADKMSKWEASKAIAYFKECNTYLHARIGYSMAMQWGDELDKKEDAILKSIHTRVA